MPSIAKADVSAGSQEPDNNKSSSKSDVKSNDKPDYSRFGTPVWPKAHILKVRDHSDYPHASKEDLQNESSSLRDQHHPLRSSRDGTGRRAGTQGRDDHHHPDDQYTSSGNKVENKPDDVEESVFSTLEKRANNGKKDWSDEEVKKVKERLEAAQKDGKTRDEALKALYEDESFVLSIREVKQLAKDWKLEDPAIYGSIRYVIPTTENDIKSQNWPGKAEQEAEKKKEAEQTKQEEAKKNGQDEKADSSSQEKDKDKSTKSDDSKSPTQDENKNQKSAPGDDDKSNNQENGESPEDQLSDEDHAWYKKFIEEMDRFAGLENNPGEVTRKIGREGARDVEDGEGKSNGHTDGTGNGEGSEATRERKKRQDMGAAVEIQVDDQFTPDSWIPRSSHLIRLTGKHPMNAEANMTDLFEAGMITPTKYHYVRNHGAVPHLNWETHTLEIFSDPPGLLDSVELSMDDITQYPSIEIPIALACDGNRRKEVNMIKKSGGFGWSAAGVSNCVWTGALVRDVLLARNMREQPANERWYLNYEGADEPSEGKYSTSIPLAYAMDPNNDVMLAYGINGEPLSPDHGFPIRSMIPAYVGGRNVKWLKKMWISKKPNVSHYHIWDNRVVPSFITDKHSLQAKAFFHHPDTACMEQVLQSVICKPTHDEFIALEGEANGKKDLERKIKFEGYAYMGGGHLVERVELSVDGGQTWKYCFRRLPDRPLRHGNKFWTWLFWECEVPLKEVVNSKEIIVRGFDVFKNPQPEHITWNLLGMMNNAWYRVKPQIATDPSTGKAAVKFIHPVEPGAGDSGWMKLSEAEKAKEQASDSATDSEKQFTLEEVEKHNKPDDAWIIINNKVYDVTSVLSWHPGGSAAILNYAGKATVDTSNDYNAIHDGYANEQRDKILVGSISEKGIKALEEDAERAKKVAEKIKADRADLALKPFSYSSAKLLKRKEISEDTRVYTFELPNKEDGSAGKLGLPIGNHVQIAFHCEDGVVMRPYTPIRPVTEDEEDGTFDLLIKSYFPSASSKFPPGGTLSNYVDCMEIGEDIDIKGPTGEITYLGKGKFKVNDDEFHFHKINLVAGGSGLTPHWQLIHAILRDKEDPTQIVLIDANSTINDVLMFDELKQYSKDHSDRFKVCFVLSKPPEDQDWPYDKGHLDEKLIKERFNAPDGSKVGTFLCGPPGLISHGAMPPLKAWGFEDGKTLFGF